MLIDTHCHLDFPDYDADRMEAVGRAKQNGIGYIINIGASLKGSRDSVALSKQYDNIYAACGIHPHEADTVADPDIKEIKSLAVGEKVIAIGEIGLDYYKNYSLPENQLKLFRKLNTLAKDLSLPVIIHCRNAEKDVLQVLKEVKPAKAVVHCFSGDEAFLGTCLDLGLYVSFTCNITYKKAQGLRDVLKLAPLDRMMLETDAPFLPIEGMRGKRNEPMYVKNLCAEVARIKGVTFEEVERTTTANAIEFFKLKI
ncbi:MAG: TatD family hydrolase [Candidatus Omnitrophota bacterium]|jgi:TatD DNase family protein